MSSSSEEEQRPGPAQGENVSESSSSTAAEGEQEQRGHSRVARRQSVPERNEDLNENDLLHSLVHERVPLRDTQVPQHSDNVTIQRLWNEVAKAMWDGWDNPRLGSEMHFVSTAMRCAAAVTLTVIT
ncbi:uncharacterized protein LOC143818524 [Ranitomeya variabilis]|uniref:uncharacterized protein LOC143818524 n=1 Tax=Ranitomeya variabilis TaxID=490064 RepID=UPI004055B456